MKNIGNEYGNYQWNIQQRQINWIETNIWKIIKDWKTQEKKSELSRQELYQIDIKPHPKNRKFKWNEHRKVTRKEWKGMKDEIEKYIWEI